jgi:hypothetical protein
MRRVDREALTRALRIAMQAEGSTGRPPLIAERLRNPESEWDTWEWIATSAARAQQHNALHLKPWQPSPASMGDQRPVDDAQHDGHLAAWELRRRLLDAGLSQWEPDPVRALSEVEAAKLRA